MSFGLRFVNNSNVVTVDSEFARLTVLMSGTYAPNAESGLTAIVSFPSAINTQEPPLVFARPNTESGRAVISSVIMYGSPGNWTGFQIRTRSTEFLRPNGRWFAAAFKASRVASFGMRLFDAGGNVIFDSGTPCAIFTRAFQNWTFEFDQTLTIGSTNFYSVPFDFPENEYILINSFAMSMVGGNNPGRILGCMWDFSARKLYATATGTSNPTAFYLPALFAKKEN
ncbi:hypothetical protein [Pseudomonas viridiflava]|uniref:hypothetical protein n=1 Tax=Pseudomonas viridiflava TaxID=33069 RepID=UPI000F03F234|nr:hypothetical protein [Pseudomonas viridiflava]